MKKFVNAKKLPLVLAVGMATQAWANDAVVENEALQVWGTEISSASSMLSDDIALKQADHLSDLLRDQPGVDIGGAHSTNQRISIRGLQDLDLEITIDGARQNNFMYHHMGNLLINADILKAVDLQVGTNSVLNGGLSGGIAFETKDAKDLLRDGQQFGARISGTAASNDYYGYSVTAYGQLNDQLDILAYFNQNDRDNPEDGDGNESVGNDGELDNGLFKVGFDIDESNRLEFSYDNYQDEGNYAPRPDMGVLTNSSITGVVVYPTRFERETMTLSYELDLGDLINLRATLYRNEIDLWRDEAANTRASYRYAEGDSEHTGFNLLAESIVDSGDITHTVRYGLETYDHDTELRHDGALVRPENAESLAVYVEDEIDFANGLTVTPGVRYNSYELETNVATKKFTDTTFGLNGSYELNDAWTVRAAATQLFQGPNLSEVFIVPRTTPAENPGLKPETGLNKEIGVSYSQNDVMNLDKLSFSLTLFQTDIDDYIDDEGVATLRNIGDYEVDGFEASLSLSKGNLDARLTYASSESENVDSGEPLGRQVGDSISLGLDYYVPAADLTLNWTSLFTQEEDYYDKPKFDVHNITARWEPRSVDGLTLTAGVENLFDEYYTSHSSRLGDSFHPVFGALHLNDYEPGRNVKLTAAYVF
ncbi:TonB-dependent receptor [Neptuniibacter sp.]|uniref:TonB-dependent receptor domain-containing protein n=1 Tax=Neptuniibacter sp. TaxID=1962643 RepID=UPI002627E197|nr:TonB-dependent receptor [Neptuniibacter sp.]MCP4595290.1 TonB-dependent receptor [Neptuniibacter sp.]